MLDNIERIITAVLGGVFGIIIGVFIVNTGLALSENVEAAFLIIAFAVIGVFTAIAVYERNKNKMMEHNNQVREETIALITHEMRTNLTTTSWAIESIIQTYSDKISPDDIKMLQSTTEGIATTVMHSVNLLDISLLDIGKLTIALEWVDLGQIDTMVMETLKKFSMGASKKGINFVSKVHLDHERKAEVDLMRLRIILENLLENAIQYTVGDKKEIKVIIENDAVSFTVIISDTGIGIPPLEQEKIFSEFYRASNARSTLGSGSGIGLYLCKEYVKAHKGKIRFESKEKEGTTFYISIPLKTVADVKGFFEKM